MSRDLAGGFVLGDADRARADELATRLERHRALYYKGAPEISDAAYDALEDELRAIDPAHPVLARVGSGELVSAWEKARHAIPMGSLNKVVSEEELRAWAARCEELSQKEGAGPVGGFFVAEKLDGISIEVVYEDGKLADAITRGDGEHGERITANVRRMKGVPGRIAEKRTMSVRGEIILRLSDLRANYPDKANPRNMAAGISKRFDGQGAEHLTALFYDVADHLDLATEEAKMALLRALGFPTPQWATGSLDDVVALHARYGDELRGSLDYEIDGLVVSVNDLRAQGLLGDVNRRPRGAVAFKFASKAKVTTVREILWDTGPSGRVTPVAIVAPIDLAGAKVQRASLHNAANVRALGIGVGDEVLVSRRNDVIPYVEEVVAKHGEASEPPSACPVCGAPLAIEGEYLVCKNAGSCRALVEGRLLIWIGTIGALEWGDKLVRQLVDAKLVKEPADLYRLRAEDIAALERRGDKSAAKCIAELRARLPLALPVFLAALGVEGFALQSARLIVSAGLDSLEGVLAATEEDLAKIPGLGSIKAGLIVRGLRAREPEIRRLVDAGIVPVAPKEQGPLAGKTFAFTGSQSRPRAELVHLVESSGGRVLSGVTKDLGYLVIADPESTSTKAVKARKLGTTLITEEQLAAMIAGA